MQIKLTKQEVALLIKAVRSVWYHTALETSTYEEKGFTNTIYHHKEKQLYKLLQTIEQQAK